MEGESAFVRILLTADDKATAKELVRFLTADMEPRVVVRVVDAGDRSKFDDLKHFVDSTPASESLSYSNAITSTGKLGEEIVSSVPTREIVILSRASFLPHARLEVLVSRCAKRGTRLILLVAEATSNMSRFRVFKDSRAPPIWIRVPILPQKLLGGISLPCFSGHIDSARLAFVGLQLMFSPEAVVSEDQQVKVRQFLESREASVLDFLDHVDWIDSSTRSDMLLALADTNHELKALTNLNCRLATVFAVHVNRYMRFRKDDLGVLVSFSDFCRQPAVRFLSQIHRIEAYLWFLFHRTKDDKRLEWDYGLQKTPHGFPLGLCLLELNAQHNIHHTANPGQILMCRFIGKAMASSKGKVVLPVPQYVDPGKGDVVTQMQEIVEHRALASSELHWQEIYDKWQSGPELTEDVLEHVLVNSACRISILLSMTPSQIFNLSLSREAIIAVSQDFDACAPLLRELGVSETPELRTRTAAIWWLLLVAGGPTVKRVSDKTFGEEQSLLLDAGLYMEPRAHHEEKERIDLLSRVAKVMVQLDMDNSLTSQHSIRNFVLADSTAVQAILDDSTVHIGNALITAIVSRETLNAIMLGSCGNLIFDRLGNILQWVKESKDADENKMRAEMEKIAPRITAEACVTLLKSANPPSDLEKAKNGILLPCIRAKSNESDQQQFLDAVLEPLCRHTPEMAIEILETLARSADEFPEPCLENLPDLWPSMFRALVNRGSQQMIDNLFARALEHIKTTILAFVLPFQSSETLCLMYIDRCKHRNFDLSDLEDHALLLASVESRTAVFKQLVLRQDDVCGNVSLLALTYFTWWSEPWGMIPLKMLPTPSTWQLFKSVTRHLKPNNKTISNGMSILARFLVAPHTLPASILNTLQKTIVGGDEPITTKTYVLAQKDSTTYPVYAFRTHCRVLPKECREYLISFCKSSPDIKYDDAADKTRYLFPLTDCGMSQKTVTHNLNILVNLSKAECSIDPGETMKLRAQLFLTIWTWFEAAGFTMKDLKDMCSTEEEKTRLTSNRIDMQRVFETETFAQSLVYQSLPVYVDVRFCSGRDVPLFQCSQESVAVTMQWLHMLTMHYNCSLDAPQEFYNYAVDRNNGVERDTLMPSKILHGIFKDIAGELVKEYRQLELPHFTPATGQESHHIVLVLDDSGSMHSHWNGLVNAVKQYISVRQEKGTQDLISIVIFNSTARIQCERMPLIEFSQRVESLLKFVGGGTKFGPALKTTLGILRKQDQDLPVALLFMSDGGSGDGEQEMREIVSEFPEIKVDTMAFGSGADTRKLQSLADIAGGKMKTAANTATLGHKFAEVASGLSIKPRQPRNDAESAREASRASACAQVVDTVLPIVDFFGQLRAYCNTVDSGDYVKCALGGLSTGLQSSEVALQVCVADALYMLLGITPANKGTEVLCLLEMWREKGLSLGSSIKAECTYMSPNVWQPSGLGDLAIRLTQILENPARPIKVVSYVRNPANTPLSEVCRTAQQGKPIEELYPFIKGVQLIPLPNLNTAVQSMDTEQTPMPSEAYQSALSTSRRKADFDHASPSLEESGQGHDDSNPDVLEEFRLFFSTAARDDGPSRQNQVRHIRQISTISTLKARTISARDLVQIDTLGGGGYSVVRIVPGLHPVLRSPGDSCAIPVLQQKSLSRRDSIEQSSHITHSKIEAIFSNNGATWEHLNQLPPLSTLMGNGFYLRKSCEGSWVLLMGATTKESLDHPPYLLWNVLDTVRLAAFDFDDRVSARSRSSSETYCMRACDAHVNCSH